MNSSRRAVRAVKNEVGALPPSIDSTAQTARLLEFMGKVLAAHNDLREPRTEGSAPGSEPSSEDAEDSEPSLASPPYPAADATTAAGDEGYLIDQLSVAHMHPSSYNDCPSRRTQHRPGRERKG